MRFLFMWTWEFACVGSLALCGMTLAPDMLESAGPAPELAAEQGPQQGQAGADFRPEYREGKSVRDLKGSVRVVQSRYIFFPEGDSFRFVLLENLNLERIARAMAERTEETLWEIDAEITEFNGANYLLIQRAQIAVD